MPRQLLHVADVAALLGLSPWTVRDKARRHLLPHSKPAGCRDILFDETQLDAWLAGAPLEAVKLPRGGRVVRAKVKQP
jgi:excisionase family DNA binding protein